MISEFPTTNKELVKTHIFSLVNPSIPISWKTLSILSNLRKSNNMPVTVLDAIRL
jgi:hypothetical protein